MGSGAMACLVHDMYGFIGAILAGRENTKMSNEGDQDGWEWMGNGGHGVMGDGMESIMGGGASRTLR